MRWFRLQASRIAAAAMLSLAAVVVIGAVPHEDDCHDVACLVASAAHDASAHQFTAPDQDDGHQAHCLACHWARSFRSQAEPRVLPVLVSEPRAIVHTGRVTFVAAAQVAQPPLRSPPSSPAHV